MMKIAKIILAGFVVLIIIGLFMPSTSGTATSVSNQKNEKKSFEKTFKEDKFFEYMLKFEEKNSNIHSLKNEMIDSAYQHCQNLKDNRASYVKSDPYFILGSMEISPRWIARTTGAMIWICPEYQNNVDEFLETITEKSIKEYLLEAYPNDEMYTDSDRQEYYDIIIRNMSYVAMLG